MLHDACRAGGHPLRLALGGGAALRLADPSPRAAKALCDRLAELLDVPLDTSELEEASRVYMQQVSEAVASDEDTAAYVDELESRVDEIERRGRPPLGRLARGRADPLPARARAGRRRAADAGRAARPTAAAQPKVNE